MPRQYDKTVVSPILSDSYALQIKSVEILVIQKCMSRNDSPIRWQNQIPCLRYYNEWIACKSKQQTCLYTITVKTLNGHLTSNSWGNGTAKYVYSFKFNKIHMQVKAYLTHYNVSTNVLFFNVAVSINCAAHCISLNLITMSPTLVWNERIMTLQSPLLSSFTCESNYYFPNLPFWLICWDLRCDI